MWPWGYLNFFFFNVVFCILRKVNKAAWTGISLMHFGSHKFTQKGRFLGWGEGREFLGVVVNFGCTFLTPLPSPRFPKPQIQTGNWRFGVGDTPRSLRFFCPKISSNFGFTLRGQKSALGRKQKLKNQTPNTP